MKTIKECKENNHLPEFGTPVVTSSNLLGNRNCDGFLVNEKHILCRKKSTNGIYSGWVPGAGGDLWWVKHEDGTVGAYLSDEIFDRE